MRSEDVTRKFALWLLDVICVQASYLLANYIRFDGNLRIHQAEGFNWRIALVLVILVTVGNYFVAINHGFMKRSAFQELKVVMTYTVYLSAGLIVTVFAEFTLPIKPPAAVAPLTVSFLLSLTSLVVL